LLLRGGWGKGSRSGDGCVGEAEVLSQLPERGDASRDGVVLFKKKFINTASKIGNKRVDVR
jgi:hypothetical protein